MMTTHHLQWRRATCDVRRANFFLCTLPLALCTCLMLLSPSFVSAQGTASSSSAAFADACKTQVESLLGREQRLYRRVLFGMVRAEKENVGAIRYDKQGNAWFKAGKAQWRSQAEGFAGTTWSDLLMDTRVERDPLLPSDEATFRTGIFATRGVLTSELIPPLTQSFRALQCRTLSVCEAMKRALNRETPEQGMFRVTVPGCRELPVQAPLSCTSTEGNVTIPSQNSVVSSCVNMVRILLDREEQLLKLSVTYDAAYRSLLQFAGTFDDFLSVFRLDLLRPLRQSLPMLQQLSRIPCFLSQCNG